MARLTRAPRLSAVRIPNPVRRLDREPQMILGGALLSLVGGVLLYSRYSIEQRLSRDEAIYTYAAEQLRRGRPPYVSIFDPKGPGAAIVGGLGAWLAHLLGANEIHGIRAVYFVCSCLTVVAVYLLAQRLFRSVAAGVVGAAVFASFIVFARAAIGGPDAKTPGMLAVVLSMWLLTRRQWLLAGVLAGVGFLVWQPLLIYFVVAVLMPVLVVDGRDKWRAAARAAAGVLIPWVLVGIYLAVAGALDKAYEATVLFPLTGIHKRPFSLSRSLGNIRDVILQNYGVRSSWLLALGIGALFVVATVRFARSDRPVLERVRDPLVCVVLVTGLFEFAYAIYDFQGGPDTIPFTPYAALGAAAVFGLLRDLLSTPVARRAVILGAAVFALVVAARAWVQFGNDVGNNRLLKVQVAQGCLIEQIAGNGRPFYSLGDPTVFAVTGRRSPDRFIYFGEYVDMWKIHHLRGGFHAWTAQIARVDPAVVVSSLTWKTGPAPLMHAWLRQQGYQSSYLGMYHVFVSPDARARARQLGISLTPYPTARVARSGTGALPVSGCSARGLSARPGPQR